MAGDEVGEGERELGESEDEQNAPDVEAAEDAGAVEEHPDLGELQDADDEYGGEGVDGERDRIARLGADPGAEDRGVGSAHTISHPGPRGCAGRAR